MRSVVQLDALGGKQNGEALAISIQPSAFTLAVALDDEEWPEVVGTLAGDDTIMVILPDNVTAETVRAKFLAMLQRAP